jgi:hypothetical protein
MHSSRNRRVPTDLEELGVDAGATDEGGEPALEIDKRGGCRV